MVMLSGALVSEVASVVYFRWSHIPMSMHSASNGSHEGPGASPRGKRFAGAAMQLSISNSNRQRSYHIPRPGVDRQFTLCAGQHAEKPSLPPSKDEHITKDGQRPGSHGARRASLLCRRGPACLATLSLVLCKAIPVISEIFKYKASMLPNCFIVIFVIFHGVSSAGSVACGSQLPGIRVPASTIGAIISDTMSPQALVY